MVKCAYIYLQQLPTVQIATLLAKDLLIIREYFRCMTLARKIVTQ